MSLLGKIFGNTTALELKGFTDWHSHILPGVDDGVSTIDESIAILSQIEQLGVRKVWLTPHIMEDIPNTTDILRERFKMLQSKYGGNVRLSLASENMIDALFMERLEAGDLLPIGENADMLLVETSYFNAPVNLMETFERIKSKGLYPVIAHPERYNYVDDIEQYREWKAAGVRFQLNILSLSGLYGLGAKKKAFDLLKNDMYDFAGSDLHREAHINYLRKLRVTHSLAHHMSRLIS